MILAGTGDDSDDAEEFLVEEKPKDQLDLIAEASANTTQADVSKSILTKGASIYYVCKIFGILDLLPPLVRISCNLSVLSFTKFAISFNPPPLLGANVIHMWITPKVHGQSWFLFPSV